MPKKPLLLLVLAISLTGFPSEAAKPVPLDQLFPPKVVARGTGFQVTDKDVENAYLQYQSAAAAQGRRIDPAERLALETKMLEKLVFMKIMDQKATTEDRINGMEKADKLLLKSRENSPSGESFLRYVKSLGVTFEEFKKRFVEQATAEAVVVRELHSRIPVTETEMKRYYLDNIKRFTRPEALKAAHILIRTIDPKSNRSLSTAQKAAARIKIEGILKRARSGEDFLKLAKAFSEDPGSKDRGGTYIFTKGQMAIEFETAAFKLRIGQISDVVETPYGYHVIKLIDREPKYTAPYEKAQRQVRDMLVGEKADEQMPNYSKGLRIKFRVEVLDPKYKLD